MTNKFKSSSNNSLFELRALLNRIENLINKDYCHVSDLLSEKFLSSLQTSIDMVEKEVSENKELL